MKKRTNTAVVLCAAVFAFTSLARCSAGLIGLGEGAGKGGSDDGIVVVSERTDNTDESYTETFEETKEAVTTEESEQSTEESVEEDTDAPASQIEYVIEIKKDVYYIDGAEVSKKRIESLLQDENAIIKIDNNYGSQKAVSELKELFMEYGVPFVE